MASTDAMKTLASTDAMKIAAAYKALEFVEPDMRLGLGSGSTAAHFVRLLGERVAKGLKVVGIPTSEVTAAQARSLDIPLVSIEDVDGIDLTVDGADEFDGALNLIKGGGGCLLREKIVAAYSARMVVVADATKKVATLGAYPLPIEVVTFGYRPTLSAIARRAAAIGLEGPLVLRAGADGSPFVTDQGNWIVDASFRRIPDPKLLAEQLGSIPGVVEHGLFLDMASLVLVAGETGVDRIDRAG